MNEAAIRCSERTREAVADWDGSWLRPAQWVGMTALALGLAGSALAQQPGLPDRMSGKEKGCRPVAEQLYVAPMGQPFRAPAGQPYPEGSWFDAADADRDGHVTLAEFLADASAFFRHLDADHDGEIAPAEIGVYENRIAPEIQLYQRPSQRWIEGRPSKAERQAAKSYGSALGAGRWAQLNIPEPVIAADLDLNGGVNADEWRQVAAQRFALLRPGSDGGLRLADLTPTPAEAEAAACAAEAAKRKK